MEEETNSEKMNDGMTGSEEAEPEAKPEEAQGTEPKSHRETKVDIKYIVSVVVGTILFYMIGKYAVIPTGVADVFIYLQYVVLVFVAGRFGPLAGGLVGLLGHSMIERARADTFWWSWVIGSMLVGVFIGWMTRIVGIDQEKPERKNRTKFALVNASCQAVVWIVIVPVLNVLMYGMEYGTAIKMGVTAASIDILSSVILCDLIMFSFDHIIVRKIVSLVTIINSIILLSYGNYGFGSILVYTATIILSIYVFMHSRLKPITTHGVGKWIKIVIRAIGCLFLAAFLFLHVSAQIGSPAGDEKCMIILGAGLNGDQPSKILQCRLDKAIEYLAEHPDILVITSGGQGEDEIIPEGEAMRNYLIEKGIDADQIIAECTSSTTEENFENSLECMRQQGLEASDSVIFVTNDFHCFRAGLQAKQLGFTNIHPLAASTPAALILNSYFREVFSVGKYVVKRIFA